VKEFFHWSVRFISLSLRRKDAAEMLGMKRSTLNNQVHRAREANDCEDFPEILRRFQFWEH